MFFDNLTKICEEQNIKLTPLLIKLNLSTGNINKWRNGTLPNGEILIKLASSLNCSIDYLLDYTNNVQENQTIKTESNQLELIENYEKLNEKGKEEALKRVHELTYISQYTDTAAAAQEKIKPAAIAAYGGKGIEMKPLTKEQLEKTQEALKKIKFRTE